MKKLSVSFVMVVYCCICFSQTSKKVYPEPEFMREVYALNSEANTLLRLQKETSHLDTKAKLGGLGGSEYGYTIDGEASKIRIASGRVPSFIYQWRQDNSATGKSGDSLSRSMANDSMAKLPQGMESMNSMVDQYMDPARTITLYSMHTVKGQRKLLVQASGGAFGIGKKASVKQSLSFKKVKDGYYEIFIDKPLPKGEYAFITSAMGSPDVTMFVFGVD